MARSGDPPRTPGTCGPHLRASARGTLTPASPGPAPGERCSGLPRGQHSSENGLPAVKICGRYRSTFLGRNTAGVIPSRLAHPERARRAPSTLPGGHVMPTPTQTTTTMSSGQVVLRCSVDDPRSSPSSAAETPARWFVEGLQHFFHLWPAGQHGRQRVSRTHPCRRHPSQRTARRVVHCRSGEGQGPLTKEQ
jgi:hypothetical protein